MAVNKPIGKISKFKQIEYGNLPINSHLKNLSNQKDEKKMNNKELEMLKKSANSETEEIMRMLKIDAPNYYESIGLATGTTAGTTSNGGIFLAVFFWICVLGLLVAKLTSSLIAASVVVGVGIVIDIGWFAIVNRQKKARQLAALNQAITRLHNIQERLQSNSEYFKCELAGLKVLLELIESRIKKSRN